MAPSPRDQRELAVALDVADSQELFRWAEQLRGLPVVLKLGLRLLPELSRADFTTLRGEMGFKLFIDMKLHDIPSQVEGAVARWSSMGADYLTVHLSGGAAMLKGAVKAAGSSTEILGVSVLTSLNDKDLGEIGFQSQSRDQVARLVKLGLDSGVRSFVCSALESRAVHELAQGVGPVRTVCPGLRMDGETAAADQSRTATLTEAIQANVRMFVMGRTVLAASNPRAKVEEIVKRLAAGV